MHISVTYSAQSILDQLSSSDRAEVLKTIDEVRRELDKSTPPDSFLSRVGTGGFGSVFMARAGVQWRVYFKMSGEQLSVEDVVSKSQLEALRMPH